MDYQTAIQKAFNLESETGRPHRIKARGYADENDVVQYAVEELVLPEPPPKNDGPAEPGFDLFEIEEVI